MIKNGTMWTDEMDRMIVTTPHQAYVDNLTPSVADRLINAVKTQAMKDYINALAVQKYDPSNNQAKKTIEECEEFFGDINKLKTVKHKITYDGGMFEIFCMEHFPDTWGQEAPIEDAAWKCPVCKDGRIQCNYNPSLKELEKIAAGKPPKKSKKKKLNAPRIVYSCDVCTYKYAVYPLGTDDESLKKEKETMRIMAYGERNRLCHLEIQEELSKNPKMSVPETDALYKRMRDKWKI